MRNGLTDRGADCGGKSRHESWPRTILASEVTGYDHQTNVSAVTSWSSSGQVTGGMCLRHDALGRLALVGGTTHYATYGDDLTCVQDSEVTQVTARYRYDARNRRVARWLSSTAEWTYFAHGPGGELLSEMKRTGDAAQPLAPEFARDRDQTI